MLNYRPIIVEGDYQLPNLFQLEGGSVILETVKPCEDTQKAFILRLYEAEGTYSQTVLKVTFPLKKAELTNMLEETEQELTAADEIQLTFRPFEIKTIKLSY